MNFKQIVIDAILLNGNSGQIKKYFCRMFKNAEKDESYDKDTFFGECSSVVEMLKRQIEIEFLSEKEEASHLKEFKELRLSELDFNKTKFDLSNLKGYNGRSCFIRNSDIENLENAIFNAKSEISGNKTLTTLIKDKHQIRLKMIHTHLKSIGYIDCPQDDFLFWFGVKELNKKPSKIHWLESDYILKNIINQLCGTSGQRYIEIAFSFKDKFMNSNYKKYIGTPLYIRIDKYMYFPEP